MEQKGQELEKEIELLKFHEERGKIKCGRNKRQIKKNITDYDR
ncbi:MAG: hypothetical protein NY202_02010 [Mollicutes bacterium UO1]